MPQLLHESRTELGGRDFRECMASSGQRFERAEWRETVRFDRHEIRLLFDLYSRRVVSGEWRDYALDCGRTGAVFSVFRKSRGRPLYAVEKLAQGAGYLLWSRGRRLRQGSSVSEIVTALEAQPHLVVATS